MFDLVHPRRRFKSMQILRISGKKEQHNCKPELARDALRHGTRNGTLTPRSTRISPWAVPLASHTLFPHSRDPDGCVLLLFAHLHTLRRAFVSIKCEPTCSLFRLFVERQSPQKPVSFASPEGRANNPRFSLNFGDFLPRGSPFGSSVRAKTIRANPKSRHPQSAGKHTARQARTGRRSNC